MPAAKPTKQSDASSAASTAPAPSAIAYLGACAIFVTAGPALILLNSRLLHDFKFPYPIALSALGVGFSAIMSRLLLSLGILKFERPDLKSDWRFALTSAYPNAALSALTLALGNSAYVHLSVALCQMLKALTPAITLVLLFLMRIETPTRPEMVCVGALTLGSLIATRGDIHLSAIGLALQLGANFAEASRIVLAQRLLASMKLPLLEMQYHVAPFQLLCLLTASAVIELREPSARELAYASVVAHPLPFAAAGVLGLLVQFAGLLAVKIAGSVAVKLLGIARGAALVLFEAAFADAASRPTGGQLGGYGASVCAFTAYTWIRLNGPSRQPATPSKKTD